MRRRGRVVNRWHRYDLGRYKLNLYLHGRPFYGWRSFAHVDMRASRGLYWLGPLCGSLWRKLPNGKVREVRVGVRERTTT